MDLERNRAVGAGRQACTVSSSLVRVQSPSRPCRPVRLRSSPGHCRLEGEGPPALPGPPFTLVPASRRPQSLLVRLLVRETTPCAACGSQCHHLLTRASRRWLPWRPVRCRIPRRCALILRPCTRKAAHLRDSRPTLQALPQCLVLTDLLLLGRRHTEARLPIIFASTRVCTSWRRR